MATKVPTLSTSSFVEDPVEKCDRLLAYYFINDTSQSTLYRGSIMSLPYHVQQHGHDEQQLREAVRPALDEYFRSYFDEVEVDVRTDIPNPADPNRINLTVSVIVIQDGKRYSLGQVATIKNSQVVNITKLNNG